jgi:hypothetical protein
MSANAEGENMKATNPKVEVLVNGKPVEHSFRVLKNGGAVIGLKQEVLNAKAPVKAGKKPKAEKKPKATVAITDGVRYEDNVATIRIGGVDVATVSKPTGEKPRKAWKKAINSNLWNAQGGAKDEAIWAFKANYGDMPSE